MGGAFGQPRLAEPLELNLSSGDIKMGKNGGVLAWEKCHLLTGLLSQSMTHSQQETDAKKCRTMGGMVRRLLKQFCLWKKVNTDFPKLIETALF